MPALAELGLSWVLHRMKIKVIRWPKIAENITIETNPSGLERVFVFRDFRVYDHAGNLLITASSTWLVFDTNKRSLSTPANHFQAIFEPYRNLTFLPRATQKFEFVRSETFVKKLVTARQNEIDTNAHVNNSVYFQWLLEPLSAEFLDACMCEEAEIQFKKECRLDDVVFSKCLTTLESEIFHVLQNEEGKEVAVARTRWGLKDA